MKIKNLEASKLVLAFAFLNLPPLTLLGLLYPSSWLGDMVANWLPQLAMLLALMAAYAWRYSLVISVVFMTLLLGVGFQIFVVSQHPSLQTARVTDAEPNFQLAQYNMGVQLTAMEWPQHLPPEVVVAVLDETNPGIRAKLKQNMPDFPYWYAPKENKYVGAIVSRVPLKNPQAHCPTFSTRCLLQVEIEVQGHPLTLFAMHTNNPVEFEGYRRRNREFEYMAEIIAKHQGPAILVGDMNNTVWSPVMRKFLEASGLRTDVSPLAMPGSWPNRFYLPTLQMTIDHALVNNGLMVVKRERQPFYASDHMPIINTIAFTD